MEICNDIDCHYYDKTYPGNCAECPPESCEKLSASQEAANGSCQCAAAGSTLDEFALTDKLATMLGISGPVSQEERNTSPLYKRAVLRAAVLALHKAWQKGA